jgi:hypothetical protein
LFIIKNYGLHSISKSINIGIIALFGEDDVILISAKMGYDLYGANSIVAKEIPTFCIPVCNPAQLSQPTTLNLIIRNLFDC